MPLKFKIEFFKFQACFLVANWKGGLKSRQKNVVQILKGGKVIPDDRRKIGAKRAGKFKNWQPWCKCFIMKITANAAKICGSTMAKNSRLVEI